MATQLRLDQVTSFEIGISPSPAELGQSLESNTRKANTLLQFHFGEQVAGVAVEDLWSACCELLLNAQLVREAKLDHFVLDVEQIFELSYAGELLFCIFSREHVFAVSREGFADSLEALVDAVFAATTCPRLMRVAAAWGASSIRGLPYSCRFSDSVLT
jgi:hypothetical protein